MGQAELVSSQAGDPKLHLTGTAGNSPFAFGVNNVHPPSIVRLGRPFSLSRTSPDGNLSLAVEEFAADHSSRRLADRSSTVYLKFEYGLGRATGGDEETRGLHGKYHAGSNHTRFESKTNNVSNGHEHQQPRALIDAYGNDTEEIF